MSMPVDTPYPDRSPVAQVSAYAWNQDGPVGGEDVTGRPAERATPVSVQGIVTVRDVPTLAATAQARPTAALTPVRLVGMTAQRRFITICLSVAGYISIDEGSLQAVPPAGLILPANTLMQTGAAGEIWVMTPTAGVASFWSELDQG